MNHLRGIFHDPTFLDFSCEITNSGKNKGKEKENDIIDENFSAEVEGFGEKCII